MFAREGLQKRGGNANVHRANSSIKSKSMLNAVTAIECPMLITHPAFEGIHDPSYSISACHGCAVCLLVCANSLSLTASMCCALLPLPLSRSTASDLYSQLCDDRYIEHDVYDLFDRVMSKMKVYYEQNHDQKVGI